VVFLVRSNDPDFRFAALKRLDVTIRQIDGVEAAGVKSARDPAAFAREAARGDALESRADRRRADPRGMLAEATQSSKALLKAELNGRTVDRLARLPGSDSFQTTSGRTWTVREDLEALTAEEARARGIGKGTEGVFYVGGRAIVLREGGARSDSSRRELVVEDARSGRVGVLTGSVVVRLKSWDARDGFLARHPSALKGQSAGIRMLLLQPSAEVNLSDFLEVVRADSVVQSAEIEVIDRQVEPK